MSLFDPQFRGHLTPALICPLFREQITFEYEDEDDYEFLWALCAVLRDEDDR